MKKLLMILALSLTAQAATAECVSLSKKVAVTGKTLTITRSQEDYNRYVKVVKAAGKECKKSKLEMTAILILIKVVVKLYIK